MQHYISTGKQEELSHFIKFFTYEHNEIISPCHFYCLVGLTIRPFPQRTALFLSIPI